MARLLDVRYAEEVPPLSCPLPSEPRTLLTDQQPLEPHSHLIVAFVMDDRARGGFTKRGGWAYR